MTQRPTKVLWGGMVPAVAIYLAAAPALAYLPVNCNPLRAGGDFSESEAIVIGRVTAVERVRAEVAFGQGKLCVFSYIATIKVGKVLKGAARENDDIAVYIGEYRQKAEDNAVPTWFGTCGTHGSLPLQINGVYLLCLVTAPGDPSPNGLPPGWTRPLSRPRSCHFSIHELCWILDPKDVAQRTLGVREGRRGGEPSTLVPLAEFLRQRMGQDNPERTPEKAETRPK